MTYSEGNKTDNKHYWLTPADMMADMDAEFNFDFDPCPFPRPDNFDGLKIEWGQSNYVNPPFGSYIADDGKKKGPTAWARKAILEHKKGKRVVLVYPIDKWIHMLLEAGAQVRNMGDIRWCAIEDGEPGPGTGRWVAMFILDPPGHKVEKKNDRNRQLQERDLIADNERLQWEIAITKERIAELEQINKSQLQMRMEI